MKSSFFYNKYLVFILAFFSPMIINIGGEVSPSFLFIVATSPFWIKNLNFKKKTAFRYVLSLLLALLAVQAIWALFAKTPILYQIKGMLIVVSGIFYFMYYYMVYSHKRDVIKWAVLGSFLASFVFINVLVEREGSEFGLWKFQIMPRLVTLCTLIYLWGCRYRAVVINAPLMFIFIGSLGLATGARSCGLAPFLAGTIAYVLQFKERINLNKVKSYLLVGSCLLYVAYAALYVPNVLNGNISGGNTDQLKAMENPYNPLGLLMIGRADAVVPFIAFMDNPLTGWGYLTPDPDYKYHVMVFTMHIEDDVLPDFEESTPIPGHSGWGYIACSYGILGFLICFLFVKKILSYLFRSLVVHDRFFLYRISVAFGFLWDFLFSPLAHFKTLPASMAIVLVFSIMALNEQNEKAKRI